MFYVCFIPVFWAERLFYNLAKGLYPIRDFYIFYLNIY